MAIAVTATVLTAAEPAPVQVLVTGMSSGEDYTVVGVYGSYTWPIPGGTGTSDGSNLLLVDNRAPLNASITYQATVDGVPYTSSSVSVTFDGVCILQDIAGDTIASVELASAADERNREARVSLFRVAGRRDMPGRYDKGLAPSMTLVVEASGTQATNLNALIDAGGPIVRRNDASILERGLPPVEILAVLSTSDALVGALGTLRQFAMSAQVVGDPEPGVVLVAFDWDDFDTIYSADTWADFDAAWSGSTWDLFDAYDWGTLL